MDLTVRPLSEPVEPRRGIRPARLARRFAGALGVLVLLGGLAVTGARLVGGDQRTPLVELAVLVPFAAIALLVTAGIAVALRGYRIAVAAGVLFAVQAFWLAPALGLDARGPSQPDDVQQVRVMTLNCYLGFADADAIVREVRDRRIDVLALEELTPNLKVLLSNAGLDQLLPHVGGDALWGASGTAIWSRWPLEVAPDLGPTTFAMPRRTVRLPSGEKLTVTAVHTLSPLPGRVQEWRADLATVRAGVTQIRGPQVVLGDFNATRDHAGFRGLLSGDAALTDSSEAIGVFGGAWPGFTWPADQAIPAFMRLDHVLVSPALVAVRGLDLVTVPGTDHRGLVAALGVKPNATQP